MSNTSTDTDMIKRAQQGSEAAFSDLLDCYYPVIHRFAYRWCSNHNDAQDITQMSCIKLARSIHLYRFEAAFTSWLYRLVINCAKDWQKSENRHQSGKDHPETLDITTEGNQESYIYLNQILHQLENLGKDMKATALLTLAEGLTQRAAAEVLQVKESTVAWRIHEIRKYLTTLASEVNR